MGGRSIDITGMKFVRLSVICRCGRSRSGNVLWDCLCECGNKTTATYSNISSGRTKSCGCLNKMKRLERNTTHGMSHSREFRIWMGMKARCAGKIQDSHSKYYSGKGIKMFHGWVDSFDDFYRYIGPCPSDKHSVDRIDGNKGYEPGNVRWATVSEQSRNRSSNVYTTLNGVRMLYIEAAEILGVKKNVISYRMKRGIPLDIPVRKAR